MSHRTASASSTAPSPAAATSPPAGGRLLRRTLLANAIFSTASGLILIVAAPWLASRLGLPALSLVVVGALLLPFAWGVAAAARRTPLRRAEVRVIVGLDLGWVTLSALALLAGWLPLTVAGVWTVIGLAEVVAIFALLQVVGLRRGGPGAS